MQFTQGFNHYLGPTVINKSFGFVQDQESPPRVNDYVPLKSDVYGDGNKI